MPESLSKPVCALEHLFADGEAWEQAYQALQPRLQALSAVPARHSAELLDWLQRLDALQRELGRLSTYAGILGFIDTRDSQAQGYTARLRGCAARVARLQVALNSLWASTEVHTWQSWVSEQPALSAYSARAAWVRESSAHVLDEPVELALAELDAALQLPIHVYRRIKGGDLRFAAVGDSQGVAHRFTLALYEKQLETSADPVLRANAASAFQAAIEPHRHALAAAYAGELTRQSGLARLRGFSRTTDFLFWLQGVDRRFFLAQREVLNRELPVVMRRFVAIKQRLLGQSTLAYYDLKACPPQLQRQVSLEQARELILAAAQRLGEDYVQTLAQAFDERWVEHGQQPNKADSSGCASPFGPHPYVLMTWTGTPRDLFLLAHELGHAVHFQWSQQHQAVINALPLRYFIEAPSTLNELLLAEHLLTHADPQWQLLAVHELLNSYYHNFVTHYLESEFQWQVYARVDEGQLPGADALQRIKQEVLQGFWGDALEIGPQAGLTWMRQQHYYMGLYPYTYAAGQSIASLFLERLLATPEEAATQWCDVLRRGSRDTAPQLLDELGLDMANPASFSRVVDSIATWVERFEHLTALSFPLESAR